MPKPYFRITVEGQDITGKLAGGNISLTITDGVGMKSDSVDIEIDDVNGVIAAPRTGVKMNVVAGYEDYHRDFGTFVVDEVTLSGWPQKISIGGQSADAKSAMKQRRAKSYQPPDYTTYGDAFAEVAGRNGLQLSIPAGIRDKKLEFEAQTEESDTAFLTRIGFKLNAAVSIKSGRLIAVEKGKGTTASGTEMPVIIARGGENILSYSVTRLDKAKHKKVKATWYDRKKAKREEVEAETGDDGPEYLLREPYQSKEEAQDAADSQAQYLKRGGAKATFSIVGNPDARAEAHVIASRIRSLVDGVWRAVSVTHSWSAGGAYSTSIECELPTEAATSRRSQNAGKIESSTGGGNDGSSNTGGSGGNGDGGSSGGFDPGDIGGTPGAGPE